RDQNDTGLGQSTSGSFTTQETYNTTTTTVNSGAVLELTTSLARMNGGIAAGLQVWNERLVLNRPGQQVAVAGASSAQFQLVYTYDTAGNAETTGALSINTTAAQLLAALNGLTNLHNQVGSFTVT